jgi:hypothetical protein
MTLSIAQKTQLIQSYGFQLLEREPDLKVDLVGGFMIKDPNDTSVGSWVVMGDNQEALLNTAIECHEMTHYMHGEWEHIFVEGKSARTCRLLLDTVDQRVLCAQVQNGEAWEPVSRDGVEDILESLNHNDVWSDKELWDDFEKSNERPLWAEAYLAA